MDARCPRKLADYPEEWCYLAVLRLKAIRNAGKELSEEDEAKCPGCPWAISHQLSNYCFFKYARDYLNNMPLPEIDVASLNSISVDTVRKIEKTALDKFKSSDLIKSIQDSYGDSGVLDNIKESDDTLEYSVIL